MKIINGYTNNDGVYFENIRNIAFESPEDLFNTELGPIVAETYFRDPHECLEEGVTIYSAPYNKNIGLRIYNNRGSYKYIRRFDDKLISELQKRQKNIEHTDFPTGVVTVENIIIGQEIVFYHDCYNLYKVITEKIGTQLPTYFYLEILKILKELTKQGILYQDLHAEQFVTNLVTSVVKLIDFAPFEVEFDRNCKYYYQEMIRKLKDIIITLNRYSGIGFSEDFNKTQNLDEVEEYVSEKHCSLLKTI